MQLLFGFAGATIGGVFHAGALGWALGSFVGGLIEGGPSQEGQRMSDLRVSSSAYNKDIHRVFGTIRTAGNVIYAQDINEIANTKTYGGFFGIGGTDVTTYTYNATFAIALCEGPAAAINKIWADSELIYDSTSLEGLAASLMPTSYEFLLGSETQERSEILETYYGSDIPAHRGLCCIVFENFELGAYGNRIPNITVEVSVGSVVDDEYPRLYETWNEQNVEDVLAEYSSVTWDFARKTGMSYQDGVLHFGWKAITRGGFGSTTQEVAYLEKYVGLDGTVISEIFNYYGPNDGANVPNQDQAILPVMNTGEYHLHGGGDTSLFLYNMFWHIAEGAETLADQYQYTSTLWQPGVSLAPPEAYDDHLPLTWVNAWHIGDKTDPINVDGHMIIRGGSQNQYPNHHWFACYNSLQGQFETPAWMIIQDDKQYGEGGTGNGYYNLGNDTLNEHVYIAATVSGGMVNGVINDGSTLAKLRVSDGEIVKRWDYVHEMNNFGQFIVHDDKYLCSQWDATFKIVRIPQDGGSDPWYVLASIPVTDGWWANDITAIGTNGVVAIRRNLNNADTVRIINLVSTAAGGAVQLSEIVSSICTESNLLSSDFDVSDLTTTDVNGFILTRAESGRSSIEKLQKGYIFDAVESDWKLKFKRRAS